MTVTKLNMPNCYWRQFEEQCKNIPVQEDLYVVEQLQSGLSLCILKNGKSKKAQHPDFPSPHDFIAYIYNVQKQESIWQPHYTNNDCVRKYLGLIPDIHFKWQANKQLATQLFDILLRVAYGEEPRELEEDTAPLTQLPGRPIDEILLTFKWLFAEEGVNYPIDRRLAGRRYPLYRIQEFIDGIPIKTVIARCGQGKPVNLPNVNYKTIDQAILR